MEKILAVYMTAWILIKLLKEQKKENIFSCRIWEAYFISCILKRWKICMETSFINFYISW